MTDAIRNAIEGRVGVNSTSAKRLNHLHLKLRATSYSSVLFVLFFLFFPFSLCLFGPVFN